MVDLLFIAAGLRIWEPACEADLAHLPAADPDAGRSLEPKALALLPASKATALPRDVAVALPRDVAVAHPALDSFDARLGASA
jgi:hypothetical protein